MRIISHYLFYFQLCQSLTAWLNETRDPTIWNFVHFHHVAPHRLLCFGSGGVHHKPAGWNVDFPQKESWRVPVIGGGFGQRTRKPLSKDHYDSDWVCQSKGCERSWCFNRDLERGLKGHHWNALCEVWRLEKGSGRSWEGCQVQTQMAETFLTASNAICTQRMKNMLSQLSPSPSRLFLGFDGCCVLRNVGWSCRICPRPFKAPNSPDPPGHEVSRRMAPSQSRTILGGRNLPMSLFLTIRKRHTLQKKCNKLVSAGRLSDRCFLAKSFT